MSSRKADINTVVIVIAAIVVLILFVLLLAGLRGGGIGILDSIRNFFGNNSLS